MHAQYDPIYIKFKHIQKNATFCVGIQIYSKNRIQYTGLVSPEFKLAGDSKEEEGNVTEQGMQVSSTTAVFYILR